MAPPTVLTPVGVVAAAIATITPAKPVIAGGILADDVVIGIGESNGGQNFPTIATNGFAHIDSVSPVVQGVNTQLSVVWRRGDFTAHAWGDSGDHNIGQYIAIRGCKTTGNPWNVVSVVVDATLDNSAVWLTATTTAADCLMLFIGGWSDDFATGAMSGGTGLGAFTEQIDSVTALGADGAIFCATADKAAAGATGAPAATLTGTAFKAMMTLALEPAPPPVSNPDPVHPTVGGRVSSSSRQASELFNP
jgi:hypothetical protein